MIPENSRETHKNIKTYIKIKKFYPSKFYKTLREYKKEVESRKLQKTYKNIKYKITYITIYNYL